jgi:quercetin dioxygenase-like cupin family protein
MSAQPTPVLNPPSTPAPGEQIPWGLVWEGIELKILRTGEGSGTYTLMTRLQPGVELPRHRHFGEVHGYTISGRWGYREYGWEAVAGDYVYEPPNSTHTLYVPDDAGEPAVIVFVIDKGMVILGENDEILTIEDAWTITEIYRVALANAGVGFPDGVLP